MVKQNLAKNKEGDTRASVRDQQNNRRTLSAISEISGGHHRGHMFVRVTKFSVYKGGRRGGIFSQVLPPPARYEKRTRLFKACYKINNMGYG